jgi:hypothetical protein
MHSPVYLSRRGAYKLYELRHPDEPWLAQGAVRYLESVLPRDGCGLEWGSGRSTQWFGARLRHLTSVEFDSGWYQRVRSQTESLSSVVLRHIELDHDPQEPTVAHYDPLPRYVAVANEFDDVSLDFVLVDGHYRQACVLAAIPKLKDRGLLAVDNTNWLPPTQWNVPAHWDMVHRSSNVMTETTIWCKSEPER